VDGQANSSLARLGRADAMRRRGWGRGFIANRPDTGDLRQAREKTAIGILPDMLESIHINRGRRAQMRRECDPEDVHVGRASVVVRDGESPLHGEGKQFRPLVGHRS